MANYKVEEVDSPTTYYDSSGRVIKIDEYGNALVPYSNNSNSLVSYPNKSNSLVPSTKPTKQKKQKKQSEPSTLEKIKTGIEIANTIANMRNPFSTSGHTIGESIGSGAKKFVNWWNQPKEKTKKAEKQLIEGPKGGGAKKTTKQTKEQMQIVPRNIKTKQVTEVGTVSTMVKKDQIQQAAQRLIEQEKQEDPLYAYERESIRNIEAAQRRRVPWRLPPIDVGMTRMTGFEPFSATADQTFNVFYGSGSIDPFIRS